MEPAIPVIPAEVNLNQKIIDLSRFRTRINFTLFAFFLFKILLLPKIIVRLVYITMNKDEK